MIDPVHIVAEMRAVELLAALEAALNGEAHWRRRAAVLLHEIAACELPTMITEALREVDARKRASEILDDLCT